MCPVGSIRGPTTLSCYKLYTKRMTWLDAEGQCRQDNGHLVSIPSTLMNRFLQKTISATVSPSDALLDQYWLGGWERAGNWAWIDNSRWEFTEWAKGEPTKRTEPQYSKCLALNETDGTWATDQCISFFPFFCSVPDSAAQCGGAPHCAESPNATAANAVPCRLDLPKAGLCYGVCDRLTQHGNTKIMIA
ncbi:CBN-CLEC-50 protein [Aphelenchoides avenae]|nr:CBN-CLEC-50 protein [Aphelenchus avenae]